VHVILVGECGILVLEFKSKEVQNMENEKEFLKVSDVARRLNVSQMTILRMIKDGQIEATRIGKSWRISTKAVERLIEENKNTRGGE